MPFLWLEPGQHNLRSVHTWQHLHKFCPQSVMIFAANVWIVVILRQTRPSKMEIYHRDNWIIIVHMATWKDLTKWNEENTIMNWINHMERIVKCVFPVPSRFQREGHTSEKYYMVYYVLSLISLYQVSNSRYQAVPGYAWLYLAVLGCTRLYMAEFGYSWLNLAVLGCTSLYLAVLC